MLPSLLTAGVALVLSLLVAASMARQLGKGWTGGIIAGVSAALLSAVAASVLTGTLSPLVILGGLIGAAAGVVLVLGGSD